MRPGRTSKPTAHPHRPDATPACVTLLGVAALGFVLLAAGPAAGAAETPPRDLQRVGDHWTAWDPPRPPEGADVHVIEVGDTLWDLAARFYGDPYLWPQLWEQNQYVLDAHWIYPGDPLVVGIEVEDVDDLAELVEDGEEVAEVTEEDEERNPILSASESAGAPVALGAESDIYCSGFIDDPSREFPFSIVGSEYETLSPELSARRMEGPAYRTSYGSDTVRYGMMTGDIVYLDGGRQGGMFPGQRFTVARGEDIVRNPLTRRQIGRFYRFMGRVRVLSVQEETAIAEIVHTCDPIPVGSTLLPFEPKPVPLGRRYPLRPVNYPTAAENLVDAPIIVRAEDNVLTMGEDNIVYIDRGEADDVVPGDIFTIYRMNRPGLPPVVLGELAVLAVQGESSVARILDARFAIRLGDRLDLK